MPDAQAGLGALGAVSDLTASLQALAQSADAGNIAGVLSAASQVLGGVLDNAALGTAGNLGSAAQFPLEVGKLADAIAAGNAHDAVGAALGIISAVGAGLSLSPIPQIKAVGIGLNTAGGIGKLYWQNDEKIWDGIRDSAIFNAPTDLHYPEIFPGPVIGGVKTKFGGAKSIPSPIALDLNGDGVIETTSLSEGAWFDHEADGFAERTAWVGKSDGLLVRDINGNGAIDSGLELFGSETLLASGEKANNGFDSLSELDGNNDGVVNNSDAEFSNLRIWQDIDADGITDAGELRTLQEAGVQSIDLGYTTSSYKDTNLNEHRQIGKFTTTNGDERLAVDVWFQVDKTFSIATEELIVPADILALPDAKGLGKVYDLHQAMTRDTTGNLKAAVTQFTQATESAERQSLLQTIIGYMHSEVGNR